MTTTETFAQFTTRVFARTGVAFSDITELATGQAHTLGHIFCKHETNTGTWFVFAEGYSLDEDEDGNHIWGKEDLRRVFLPHEQTNEPTPTKSSPATRAVWALVDPYQPATLPESAKRIADKIGLAHPWRLELENLFPLGDVDDPSPERQGAHLELRDLITRMVDETCTWQSAFESFYSTRPTPPPTRSAQIAEHAKTLGQLVAPLKVEISKIKNERLNYALELIDWYTTSTALDRRYDNIPAEILLTARALAWLGFWCERNRIGVDSTHRHPMFSLGSGRRLANDGPCYDQIIAWAEEQFGGFTSHESERWGQQPSISFVTRTHTILCSDRPDLTIEMPVVVVSGGSFESPVEISVHELISWAPPAFLIKMLSHDAITKNVTSAESVAYRKLFWFAYGADTGYQIALFIAASEHQAGT